MSTVPSTVTALTDSLPSDVPKLLSTSANWAIFDLRFSSAVQAKGKWGHFDGTITSPMPSNPPSPSELATVAQWTKDEAAAKNLLLQKLPDSTAMKIRHQATVHAAWTAIAKEYTEKSMFAQTELCTSFLESKCAEKGNVRQFLDDLWTKQEELSSVSVDVDDKDYRSTIILSLPTYLSNFASSQLAVTKLYSPSKTIEPDALISLISEKFERQKTQRTRRAGGAKSKDDTDEVLFAGNVKKAQTRTCVLEL
jgi:hypothetical protein